MLAQAFGGGEMMIAESDLAKLWPKKARKEGHRPGLPPTPKAMTPSDRAQKIRKLRASGMTHQAIARVMGMSRSRVTQELARE